MAGWITDRLYEAGAEPSEALGSVASQAAPLAVAVGAGYICGFTALKTSRMLRNFQVCFPDHH